MNKLAKKRMTFGRWTILVVLAVALGSALLWSRWGGNGKPEVSPDSRSDGPMAVSESIAEPVSQHAPTEDRESNALDRIGLPPDDGAQPPIVPLQPDGDDLFATLLTRLSATDDPRERQALLDQAAAWLMTLATEEATAILVHFLESGEDFDIGMPFRVGIGGNLRSHPALRVAALDWLGQIAPEVAKNYAREIFEHSDSADEWALALRNYGRQIEPGADAYFSEQVRQLVLNEEWRQTPTGGYAEAFDMIVYNKQYALIADIVSIQTNAMHLSPLASSILVSLTLSDTSRALENWIQNLASLDHAPLLRAQIFALADLSDPMQISFVDSYFSASTIPLNEKQMFLERFPDHSRRIAHRLLSVDTVMTMNAQVKNDVLAYRVINQWLASTNSELHDNLLDARQRIYRYMKSAAKGGFEIAVNETVNDEK